MHGCIAKDVEISPLQTQNLYAGAISIMPRLSRPDLIMMEESHQLIGYDCCFVDGDSFLEFHVGPGVRARGNNAFSTC